MRVPPRTQGKTQARADASAVSRRLVLPVQRYIHAEEAAGLMLAIGAAIGLIWANSPWARSYEALLHKHMAVHLGPLALDKSLHHWINDGLMSLFFVVVGLEINREMVHGQLRHIRGAALPLFAAIGGMVVPAAAYLLFNAGTDGARGWGIPVATDIAFALGALAVLGDRVPHALRIFLLAFATVDDIGGILVIALFYTEHLSWTWAAGAAVCALAIFVLRRLNVQSTGAYGLLGVLLWLAVLQSGVHATIAGVVFALLTPARRATAQPEYLATSERLIQRLRDALNRSEDDEAAALLGEIEERTRATEEPADRLDRHLRPWVSYLVLPVFALANAGVPLSWEAISRAGASPITQGIVTGLLIGKAAGILGASWLAVRMGVASLPTPVSWTGVAGASVLAGIGFTVSLFIAGLAFEGEPQLDDARIAILGASALAAVAGMAFLRWRLPRMPAGGDPLDTGAGTAC